MNGLGAYWEDLGRFGGRTALVDAPAAVSYTYEHLDAAVRRLAGSIALAPPGIVLVCVGTTASGAIGFLASLQSGRAVYLVSDALSAAALSRTLDRFRPAVVVCPRTHGLADLGGLIVADGGLVVRALQSSDYAVNPSLRLLLSTSGSLGAPKAVRLSDLNVRRSAGQVVQALALQADDRALLTLPLSYTYGLSVLASHLLVGACVVLEPRSILSADVWDAVEALGPSSMAGVAFTIETLMALGAGRLLRSSIRTLTHSGDPLTEDQLAWLLSLQPDIDVYRMYGMTEATSRIAVLPCRDFHLRPHSVGRVVADGAVSVEPDGEVVFDGPNVMMGYASDAADLGRGDDLGGRLFTGDLGHLDADGFLHLTGRTSRIFKFLGARISLDEIEARLSPAGPVSVVSAQDEIRVRVPHQFVQRMEAAAAVICADLGLPRDIMRLVAVDTLPRQESGKLARTAL